MYKLIKQGDKYNDPIHFYICDTPDDLDNLPFNNAVKDSIGDEAYIIDTGEEYVRDSDGKWRIKLQEGGGAVVNPEDIQEAVDTYLEDNPVEPTPIDTELTQEGNAADAKAVGDALNLKADKGTTLEDYGIENAISTEDVLILQGGNAASFN